MKIKMLNSETINKIAAGEVIIKPVSVIKELVENSIDAKATRITVLLESGGKNLMVIRDNGCGISYNEVPLAFKRHGTSKLTSIEDLETIESLGFRGEALSSVSAVARVQITTRYEEEEVGSVTYFEGGNLKNQSVCSYSKGTELRVSDLFYNTPARRKHLEKDKKEEQSIREMLEKLALSNPEISFQLISNGKNIFTTLGTGKLIDVVNVLYGEKTASSLIPLSFENSPMKLSGFIGDLTTTRTHREDQIFFINGRYIKNFKLAQGLDEAYDGYTMKHQHPFGLIFLELPGKMLDVNIHPAKTEIKILNESLVILLFKQGIRETLRKANLVVDIVREETVLKDLSKSMETQKAEIQESIFEITERKKALKPEKEKVTESKDEKILFLAEESNETEKANEEKREVRVEENFYKEDPKKPMEVRGGSEPFEVKKTQEKIMKTQMPRPDFLSMKIVGQLFNTYILLEKEQLIYLIDQHAAHEAFLTKELHAIFNKEKEISSQILLEPKILKTRPKDLDRVTENLTAYKKIGYDCEIFGEDSIIIRSVPILLGEPQSDELLNQMISENSESFGSEDFSEKSLFSEKLKNKIILMACKAAIKGGQKLDHFEIKKLLEQLMKLDNPFTCPHGRPIITKLREYDLMKLFKRVV